MTFKKWSDAYLLNVPDIDDQHLRFVGYVNALYDLRRKKCTPTEVARLISELQDYARLHFQTEERYFSMVHYPDAELHRSEHQKILQTLKEFNDKAAAGADLFLAMKLANFLNGWLDEHVVNIDKKFCGLLLNQGGTT
jgi:hemerythrin